MEFQRNLIRSANTGISAHINKYGVVLNKLDFNTSGIIQSDTSATKGSTPFSRFGDYPLLMLVFIIVISYVVRVVKYE